MSGVPRPFMGSLLAFVLAAAPCPALAAGQGIEREPETIQVPGPTAGVVSVETDDGAILVRLAGGADGRLQAEAWALEDEAWRLRGQAAPLAEPVDRVRLVVARLDGVPTAVAVSSPARAFACCTSVVALPVDRGGVRVEPIGELDVAIDALVVADLDGDGNDELVLRSVAVSAAEIAPTAQVIRAVDGGLDVIGRLPLRSRLWETPFLLGDTDGLAGEEVGLLDHSGPGHLGRIAWRPEGPALETASLFAPRLPRQDVTGVRTLPDGGIVTVNTGSSHLARWPAGTEAELLAGGGDGGLPLGVLSDGSAVRVVTLDLLSGAVRILDERLRRVESFAAPSNIFGSAWLPQYTGPYPRTDGGSAIAAYGVLYELAGDELHTRPAAGLGGTHPIAPLGADGERVALLRSLDGRPMHQWGGQLRARRDWINDRLSIAPTDLVLSAQPELLPEDWITLDGAVVGEPAATDPGSVPLIVSAQGYRLAIAAPPGSQLHLREGSGESEVHEVGDDRIWLEPETQPTSSDPLLLAAVTPSGRTYTARVTVERVLTDKPSVDATTTTSLFSPRVVVTGRTTPDAEVTIDGSPAAVDAEGAFAANVTGGLLPRSIGVEAVDPLGGRARIEVIGVGFVDYLSLPWAALLTIGALAAVALVIWRRPPAATARAGSDGLEEIGPQLPDDLAAILRPGSATPHQDRAMPDPRDDPPPDDAPDPDVLPADAPRGAQTIPSASQTGVTTPPITGYGQTLTGEERVPEPDEEEEAERR